MTASDLPEKEECPTKGYGKTDIGVKRKNNQDSFAIIDRSEYMLAVVCDGVGGARGGNIASETAVKTFCAAMRSAFSRRSPEQFDEQELEDLMKQAVGDANTEVYRKAAEDSDLEGMGTTLVAALLCKAGNFAVNVGDSRLYLRDSEGLRPLTKDNTFVQYLVDRGVITPEEAPMHPDRNIILRALGGNEEVETDFYRIPAFDRLLLCSDGLYNMLPIEEMCAVTDGLFGGKRRPPGYRARVNELIRRANQHGGQDNITAILIGTD